MNPLHVRSRRPVRLVAALLGALVLVPLLGSCGGADAESTSKPTPSSETNQDRYEEALARFTEYEKVSEPIWAKGKYTPEAQQLLAKYWATTGPKRVPATYQLVADARLRQADANQVQLKGLAKVLSSKPVKLDGKIQVEIEQCVDHSTETLFQFGKKRPSNSKGPVTRKIVLVRNQPQLPWLIASLDERLETNKSCG